MSPPKYSNLTFASQADYEHVSPVLLQKMNALGKSLGKTIDIISGYRTDEYSAKVGGFAGDPHTKGIAVDAYIDGKPIGDVVSVARIQALGLRSGNVPNFYNGKPDPEHVDMAGADGSSAPAGTGSVAPLDQSVPARQNQTTASSLIAQDAQAQTPMDPVVGGNVIQPATADPTPWEFLASLPGASPDTMRLAQLASLNASG